MAQGAPWAFGIPIRLACRAGHFDLRTGAVLDVTRCRSMQLLAAVAFIGHVEATYQEDEKKNELCKPVPHPNADIDFLRNSLADSINRENWDKDPKLQRWLQNCRLDFTSHVLNSSRLVKFSSLLSRVPFLPRPNRIAEAQAKATRNVERILKDLDS
jgi:hypothetical protein